MGKTIISNDLETAPEFISRIVAEKFSKLRAALGTLDDQSDDALGQKEMQLSALGQARLIIQNELEYALCGNRRGLHLGAPVSMDDLHDRMKYAARSIWQEAGGRIVHNPLGDSTVAAMLYHRLDPLIGELKREVMAYGRDTMVLPNGGYHEID